MQSNNQEDNKKQEGLSWSTPGPAHKEATPATDKTQSTSFKTASSMTLPPASPTAKYVGMIVIGIVVGVIIAWAWAASRMPSNNAQATATTTPATNAASGENLGVNTASIPTLGSNPALAIASPQAAGKSVTVTKVSVSAATWIVIYENNAGKPGNALGARLFFPENQSGTVGLLRATVAGNSYFAVKQVDNGDRKFSLKGDQLLSEGGEVKWVTFDVQ